MHVAIIMDGNGRWATLRGLPRTAGHREGAKAVRRVVEAAAKLPVDILTLFAFSCDNWSRPTAEVRGLFKLMKHYLQTESAECADNGITIKFIGRRDRFSDDLRELVDNVEKRTKGGNALLLRIAADYSSRGQILRAACSASKPDLDVDSFGRLLNQGSDAGDFSGNVDLLVRTGGESRLSDFLLWECAYAELAFVNTYWPDFNEQALKAILEEYKRRDRRFGRIPNTLPAIPVCETP